MSLRRRTAIARWQRPLRAKRWRTSLQGATPRSLPARASASCSRGTGRQRVGHDSHRSARRRPRSRGGIFWSTGPPPPPRPGAHHDREGLPFGSGKLGVHAGAVSRRDRRAWGRRRPTVGHFASRQRRCRVPVIKLAPPFSWADDVTFPSHMEVLAGPISIRRGCGPDALACNLDGSIQALLTSGSQPITPPASPSPSCQPPSRAQITTVSASHLVAAVIHSG